MIKYQNSQKQLAYFINFQLASQPLSYNTINGILTPFNIKSDIKKVATLLKRDYIFLDYNRDTNEEVFLEKLADALSYDKTVFIFATTLKINPIIYDQLFYFRDKNKFSVHFKNKDLGKTVINPKAKVFLVAPSLGSDPKEIYSITDHVLNLDRKD